MSRIHLKLLALLVAAAAGVLALLVPTVGSPAGAAPVAARPTNDPPPLDGIRQATVDRANKALRTRHFWMHNPGTVKHLSTLHTSDSPPYNYLGADGSNSNRNVYTGYRVAYWCGYFAAEIWTGVMVPDAARYPRLPQYYENSQQWATGPAYHRYSATHLPTAGDVLIWQDGAGAAGSDNGGTSGHVGVVTSVNYQTKWVTTMEGNQATAGNSDSIVQKKYQWTHAGGPFLSGKHFRGFRSRD